MLFKHSFVGEILGAQPGEAGVEVLAPLSPTYCPFSCHKIACIQKKCSAWSSGGGDFYFFSFLSTSIPWLTLQFDRSSFKVLKLQRDWIAEEMKELNLLNRVRARFCFLYPEYMYVQDQMKQIVVVSSWRSGSSLIGGLFDSHPGASNMLIRCNKGATFYLVTFFT